MNEKILVFLLALTFDLTIGELPNKSHPVFYMGKIAKIIDKKRTNISSNSLLFILGFISLATELFLWVFSAYFVTKINYAFFSILLSGFLLKSTFSIKGLYKHVKVCETQDIEELRKRVSYIVSRDTSKLDAWHLYSAAIESLAENISDSVTGPLFYYCLFGLPGAVFYRVVNTFDALFGYRNEKYEWFGKIPARFDDILNFLPARITALFISVFNPKGAFRYIKKYGGIKINATYPMSAFAGVLGLKFEKIGYYSFEGKEPELADIKKALSLYTKTIFLLVLSVLFVLFLPSPMSQR